MDNKWEIATPDAALTEKIGKALGVSDTIAAVLVNRGILDTAAAEKFFYADRQEFEDPFLMRGMDQAVERIMRALREKEKITVYGDYDVDGITATSLLLKALGALGGAPAFYIPERQSEGYGLHAEALEKILADGTTLVITVDCGISAAAEVAQFAGRLDIVLTDHHVPPEVLPQALAVLNPQRKDCPYPEKSLAGVGVAYKLCQGLWQKMRGEKLQDYLELAALGTVADVVPLLGENRLIVARGLKLMESSEQPGLRALLKVCALEDKKISAGHIGFMAAPRLNAAGRLGNAACAVELLTTRDLRRAAELAEQLDIANQERQRLEKLILEKAEALLESVDLVRARVVVAAGEGWNPGVIGIVASRLVERYYRPAVVIGVEGGIGRGSCRSIREFHMYEALRQCADLLEGFGGHAQAAGLTIRSENIDALRARLEEIAGKTLTAEDYIPSLSIDASVSSADITEDLIASMECLEPYGMGNPQPVFACMDAVVREAKRIGGAGAHLRFGVEQAGRILGGVAWNMGDSADGLLGKSVDLAFQVGVNEWNGRRSIQLKAQDFRPHERILSELDQLFLANQEEERYKDIDAAQQFFTKAVGVTFEGRQAALARLRGGQRLILRRQMDNPYDQNAVAILTQDGAEIGYVRAQIAAKIAPLMDCGEAEYAAQVCDITGGAQENYGVNLFVWRVKRKTQLLAERCAPLSIDAARRIFLGERPFHAAQTEALEALQNGKNTLVIMGTGRGKSAIFQTHAAMLAANARRMTVILYPLRALVNDQYLRLRERLEPLGILVYKGNGTLSAEERGSLLEAAESRAADILLTTPEFLQANMEKLHLDDGRVGFFVVDESHHIADGARRPAYKNLAAVLKRLGRPPVLAVTATADAAAAQKVQSALSIEKMIIDPTVRENLMLRDRRNADGKEEYLRSLLRQGKKTLIFVNSRKKAVELAEHLRRTVPLLSEKVGFYHAGLSNAWRVKAEEWFKAGKLQAVVATSAFGEGVDLPDIAHVVQYHLPFDLTTFNQQCGRAGRDGGAAEIHLLFGEGDVRLNRLILQERAPERETIGRVYLLLKRQQDAAHLVTQSNAELARLYDEQYRKYIGESGIGACLKILEDLRLIVRERFGGVRQIDFQAAPAVKLDLLQSGSYAEGLREREDFEEFAAEALNLAQEKLLSCINRPIYPGQ